MTTRMICLLSLLCSTVLLRADTAPPQTQPAVRTLPESRGGQDLIGTKMPPLKFDRWLGHHPPDLDKSVVLYRWWTDKCPFCARTLPAVEQLRKEFGPRGLKVVAVFHPKPPGNANGGKTAAAAQRIGYGGAIAIDPDWDVLRRVWLSTGHRHATSVSFLVDRNGIIRFVHPGVQFFPSADPAEASENADYQLLRSAIDTLLPRAGEAQKRKEVSESDAEELVAEIPEVGRYLDSVNTKAHGQSHGLLFSQGHPADAPTQWEIYVGENRDDDGAVCWHRFRVDLSGAVSVEAGKWIGLREWETRQAERTLKPAEQNAK